MKQYLAFSSEHQTPYAALPMRIWTLVSISNHEIEVVDGQGR
jgi:hypothetical protein